VANFVRCVVRMFLFDLFETPFKWKIMSSLTRSKPMTFLKYKREIMKNVLVTLFFMQLQ